MMKIYTAALIHAIQSVINSGKFEMTTYKDYSFFTSIRSTEFTLIPGIHPTTGNRDCILNVTNCDLKPDYITKWHQTAPGKFLSRDYKKESKDFIGNTLYHELKLTVNNNKVKILVRLLNEITEPGISEEIKKEYISSYGDITIDGKYFSVIKICDDTKYATWSGYDKYKSGEHVIEMQTYENTSYSDINTNADGDDAENISLDSELIEDIADESSMPDALF